MDKIYSRRRIRIPKVRGFYENKNAKKFFSIFVIFAVTIFTFVYLFMSLNPVFENIATEKAKEIGTVIINEASNKVLQSIDYKEIVTVEKSNNNNILKTDVSVINKIASQIALEAEKMYQDLEKEEIGIPIGAITGNKYLVGTGPNINIKVIPVGSIETQIKNEFIEKGINQTIYRIYLEVTCNVSIVTGYKTINDKIVNQVLLVETVVVGNVPNSYYNLDGSDRDEALELIH